MSNRRFACLVLLLSFLGAGVLVALLIRRGSRDFDLSSKPPAQVFQQVFKIPPPAGVRELRAVGWAALSGEVLMRFQADDVEKVLSALKANPLMPLYDPAPEKAQAEMYIDQAARNPHCSKIGWPERARLLSLPAFGFPERFGGSGWSGVVLVDRRDRTVYVIGQLY